MKIEKILEMIFAECSRAEKLHPVWPKNLIHACLTVSEESGELAQAVLNYDEKKGSKQNIIIEAVHTAATAIRFLKNIEEETVKNETHL